MTIALTWSRCVMGAMWPAPRMVLSCASGRMRASSSADAPRRQWRARPVQQQGRHSHQAEVLESGRLVERCMKVERHLGEARGHCVTLIRWNRRPRARTAPIVDETPKAGEVFAAGGRARDVVGDFGDLGECLGIVFVATDEMRPARST